MKTTVLVSMLFLGIGISVAFGQIPHRMNYQGMLSDASGSLMPDGNYTLVFKLYDSITGGTALWTESQNVVVSKGVFNVILGSNTPLDLSFDKPYFLGTTVGSGGEMTPRIQLTSVAYSLNAEKVKGSTNIFPSSGNVGVGTTSPQNMLEVKNNIAITGSGTEGGQLSLIDGDGTGGWEIDNFGSSGTEALRLFRGRGTNDIFNVLNVNMNGMIGMSTATPSERLEVNGFVKSDSGYKFPDGTVQKTAASGTGGGLKLPYSDSIASFSGSAFYVKDKRLSMVTPYDGPIYGGYFEATGTRTAVATTTGLLAKGDGVGVHGIASLSLTFPKGVYGEATNTDGSGYGVYGVSLSSGGTGVYGEGKATSGSNYGVYGVSLSSSGCGVYGECGGTTSGTERGTGVYGIATSTSGVNYGGYFVARGQYGDGIYSEGFEGIYAKGSERAATFAGDVRLISYSTGDVVMMLGEGLDYAEGFNVTDKELASKGAVLTIDPDHPGSLRLCNKEYDKTVAGVISGANGLGSAISVGGDKFDFKVALAGRVYCDVDASENEIEPGDLLTTSSVPGYAMKAVDKDLSQGCILGKAMQKLEKGKKGLILVLVTLQ